MTNLTAKWKALPGRRRVMLVAAVSLLALVAGKYGRVSFSLPTPGVIAAENRETAALERRLGKARRRDARRARSRQTVMREARSLVWEMNGANPSTEAQAALERVARTARVTIRTMGRPRTSEVSENIRGVEISLNMRGTMREIGRFLIEARHFSKPFEWTVCAIRPTNPRDPSSVTLTGSVAVYYLSPAAEAAVFRSGDEKP